MTTLLGDPTSDGNPGMEIPTPRKVRPVLAFLANFLGLGLGYVYVGELRLAIVALVATYSALAFFAWTGLLVSTASIYWIASGAVTAIVGFTIIHPVVLAVRNRHRALKPYNRWWLYLLWSVGYLVLANTYLAHRNNWFGYATYRTPSESMSPTLQRGDFFMANMWRYRDHAPSIDEIVVYVKPSAPGIEFVKRIVGIPGDRIEGRNSVLYRNGQPVAERYLHSAESGLGYERDFPLTVVPPGAVFVLGDYRDNSVDSRAEGPVAFSNIRGRAEFIWFSFADGKIRWKRISEFLRPT
jgi:signal peptidase I